MCTLFAGKNHEAKIGVCPSGLSQFMEIRGANKQKPNVSEDLRQESSTSSSVLDVEKFRQ